MEYYIENKIGQTSIASIKDGDMNSFTVEQFHNKTNVGAVYVARVKEVNKAQSMAILSLGNFDAVLNNFNKLTEGQTLLVQVIRDGFMDKMPAVHTRIVLENRFFKISNNGKGFGFDKQAGNGKVKSILEGLGAKVVGSNDGVVIKTTAVDIEESTLKKSYDELKKSHTEILATKLGKVGLVKDAMGLIENTVINSLVGSAFVTDCLETLQTLKTLKKSNSDIVVKEFKKGNLFNEAGISEVVDELLERKVSLDGGGDIVIDETEALIAIDVNASDLKTMKKGDDAIFKLNKRAAVAIAKQIVLRNLSGLIVIDFVRLKNRGMAKQLPKILKAELQKIDINGTFDVMDLTKTGLVEMTRKRTSPSISEILQTPIKPRGKNNITVGLELLQKVITLNGAGTPTVYAGTNVIYTLQNGDLSDMTKEIEKRINKEIKFIVDTKIGVELK
ncbi:MAG: ribonuclease E/G [Alphaproteobacteria bacterium]